jgi:AbiV family abortive infection protein
VDYLIVWNTQALKNKSLLRYDMSNSSAAIRSKQKVAELVDTAFTLINEGNVKSACSYYMQALEELGKILILKSSAGQDDTSTLADEESRNTRIEQALRHMQKSQGNSLIVKNSTGYVVKDDIDGTELKMAVVAIKTGLPFL